AKQFNFDPGRYLDREVTVDSMTSFALPLVLIGAAAIALTLGLRWRQHALLIAFALCVVLLAIELRDVSTLTIEAKLIVYGIVILISSVILERRLRRPHGVTSLPLGRDSDAWKIIELGTAATLATSSH